MRGHEAVAFRALGFREDTSAPFADRRPGEWNSNLFGPAALGEGGSRPSFSVHTGHGGWKDHGGHGERGDLITAARKVYGGSFYEACRSLLDAVGVPYPPSLERGKRRLSPRPRAFSRPANPPAPDPEPTPAAAEPYAGDGRAAKKQPTAEHVRQLADTLAGDSDAARSARAFLMRKGLDADALARWRFGLDMGGQIGKTGKPGTYVGPCIYLPLRWNVPTDGVGEACVSHARVWAFDPERGAWALGKNGGKRLKLDGCGASLFPPPEDLASGDAPRLDVPGVMVCEGETDTLAARAAGLDAFTSTDGAGKGKGKGFAAGYLARLAERPHASGGLCLAFDADEAGDALAAEVFAILDTSPDLAARFGGKVRRLPIPLGLDVGDLVVSKGPGGLTALARETFDREDEPARMLADPDTASRDRLRDASDGTGPNASHGPIPNTDPYGYDGRYREFEADVAGRIVPLFGFDEPPARQWIIPGWMPEGYGSILAADGGSGKSYLAMLAAVCVATGRRFLGKRVNAAPVLYVDYELDAAEQMRRLSAVLRGLGLDQHHPGLRGRFHYFRPDADLSNGGVDEIAEAARQTSARFIVLDSLTIALGGDSMSQADVTHAMVALRDLSILYIDHVSAAGARGSAKDARPFGSVFKRNLARATFQLGKEEGGMRVLRPDKSNFGPGSDSVSFRMEFADNEGSTIRFTPTDVSDADDLSLVLKHAKSGEKVTAAVRSIYAASPAAFRAFGVKPEDVTEWLENVLEPQDVPSPNTIKNRLSMDVNGKTDNQALRKHADGGYLPLEAKPETDRPGEIGGRVFGSFEDDHETGGEGNTSPPPSKGPVFGIPPLQDVGEGWDDAEDARTMESVFGSVPIGSGVSAEPERDGSSLDLNHLGIDGLGLDFSSEEDDTPGLAPNSPPAAPSLN